MPSNTAPADVDTCPSCGCFAALYDAIMAHALGGTRRLRVCMACHAVNILIAWGCYHGMRPAVDEAIERFQNLKGDE